MFYPAFSSPMSSCTYHLVYGVYPGQSGQKDIDNAAQAAEALRPLAGDTAGILFAAGIIAVGFLAVPVMPAGAAYDFCQVLGKAWLA
jgi:Mn2+/Fe2+ NRAMP family transporter